MYDFANILFSGPCNARCPTCIGQQVNARLNANNLDEFPPRNLDRFVAMIREYNIRQVVFSGTTTDPQLYRHEARLLASLRRQLPAETRFGLHTNGRLALRKMDIFNLYDSVCLSLPSFDPLTYRKMMGVPGVPDLTEVLRQSRAPVKISCLVYEPNIAEIAGFLDRCCCLGIRRVVLRKLYGEKRSWQEMGARFPEAMERVGDYRNNPVFHYRGLQVTLWDFDQTESASINLFSSGEISSTYLLAKGVVNSQQLRIHLIS